MDYINTDLNNSLVQTDFKSLKQSQNNSQSNKGSPNLVNVDEIVTNINECPPKINQIKKAVQARNRDVLEANITANQAKIGH